MLFSIFFSFKDNSETAEAKGLFEANFSHIYHILYDSFVQAEANLRQRGLCEMTNLFDVNRDVITY